MVRTNDWDPAVLARFRADPFVASVLAAFPGAELTEVRQTAVPVVEAAPDDDSDSEETP